MNDRPASILSGGETITMQQNVSFLKDKLISDAWARWRQQDYSWEGLKERTLSSNSFLGKRTLQDVWRRGVDGKRLSDEELRNAGMLVERAGQKTYHIAHLPLTYDDGQETIKFKENKELSENIQKSIRYIFESKEKQINLSGCVLDKAPKISKDPISFKYEDVIFTSIANFQGTSFNFDTSFWNACFLEGANFNSVIFNGKVEFNNAFFLGDTYFWMTNFKFSVFNNVNFFGAADFHQATFEQELSSHHSIYFNRAAFRSCTFRKSAQFVRCIFSDMLTFELSKFSDIFYLTDCTWPVNGILAHKAFDKVIFREVADFRGSGFKLFAAFDGATFERGLKLDRDPEPACVKQFEYELEAARRSVKTFDDEQPWRMDVLNIDDSAKRIMEIESGCRLLKQEMARSGDKNREQLLYKFEVKSQKEHPSTSSFDKIISQIYDFISDYGTSISRPLIMLFLSFWFFSQLYALMYPTTQLYWGNLIMGLAVSGSRIFPFGAFGDVSKEFAERIAGDGKPVTSVFYMFAATFQSFTAIILIFLAALAVRRRFQIS